MSTDSKQPTIFKHLTVWQKTQERFRGLVNATPMNNSELLEQMMDLWEVNNGSQ